jgi:hypothetical protein
MAQVGSGQTLGRSPCRPSEEWAQPYYYARDILKPSYVVSTAFRVREQASTGAVEIIEIVIVAEEHVIEWTDRRAESWSEEFLQRRRIP